MDLVPNPEQIFSSSCMDVSSLLKVTEEDGRSFDIVFVIMDRLSCYSQAIPCLKSGLTADKAPRLFMDHCVYFMGIPLEILSD